MDNIWILAQAETNQEPSGITSEPVTKENEATIAPSDSNIPITPAQRPGFGYSQLIFLGVILVIFYFLLFRGPRKKQQEHKEMVQSLSKNDKVRTIGGIIGTVVDIKGEEITLKVDESNNTKIKIVSSAIGKKLSKD
jgi:preprotein translocase subunit YajC